MSIFKTENILGYKVTASSAEDCCDQISNWLSGRTTSRYFVCANPHSIVTALSDKVFSLALHSADLIVPDGAGVVLASKVLDGKIIKRVTGFDIFINLTERLNRSDVRRRVFFLGSSDSCLIKIKEKMAVQFPNIEVETFSPPFKEVFSDNENEVMCELINRFQPDLLWVGMTAPKQEKWIYQNKDKLKVPFIGAIGAVFDFYVGNVQRSHPWFQEHGLEWLPRLIQQPRKLWRRNFISSPVFLFLVLRQKFLGNN